MKELGIYVHIPFCKQKCSYCDFISFKGKETYIKDKTDIENKIERFSEEELLNITNEYDNIINEWDKELRNDLNNHMFKEELNLFTRLKYDNKQMDPKIRGDRDEVLYFLKDFNVPSTNNDAESSQRGVKIKQKIGKFRGEEGANNYLIIKSCILTYKKQKLDILDSIKQVFEGQTILGI